MLDTHSWAERRYRLLAHTLERRLATAFTNLPRASTEDAIQHAWEQLVRKPPGYFQADGDPAPWLFVVARNALRGESGRELAALGDDVPAPALDLDASVDAGTALAGLTLHQRTALTCRMLGLSYRESSAATGRTYTWVNRHTTEGRAAVRVALG